MPLWATDPHLATIDMTVTPAFGRFVALSEDDAPRLLQRMTSAELPVQGERYGIVTRLIARDGAVVADLAGAVLDKLLASGPVADIAAVILSSRIDDPRSAIESALKQRNLVYEPKGVERACSGFPAATAEAVAICRTTGKHVALVTAEIISRSINWEAANGDLRDQKRARGQAAKLFADGAAAVMVGPQSDACPHEILDVWHGEIPDDQQLIQKTDIEDSCDPWGRIRPGLTTCISMPGRRGFWLVKRAPQIMADAIARSLATCSGTDGTRAVEHIVPHQPNALILTRLQALFQDEPNTATVWNCIEHAGNTVSASIPLAMSEVQDKLPTACTVAMPSIGAGGPGYRPNVLSNGCVLVQIGTSPGGAV